MRALTGKAVLRDGLEHSEKVGPVLGEVLQVLAHHLQGTLKQSVHDGRNVVHCLRLSAHEKFVITVGNAICRYTTG